MDKKQKPFELDATALCLTGAGMDLDYDDYHWREWGRPVTDDGALFERLCLEGFQVGLSWATVLHKRDAFREVFCGFDPEKVAAFDESDIERLMGDARIVRNRAKIIACISGARAVLGIHDAGECLSDVIWGFAPAAHARPADVGARPKTTPESVGLAAELHRRGFRFIGAVNAYATMQACGLVNDHIVGCVVGDAIDV